MSKLGYVVFESWQPPLVLAIGFILIPVLLAVMSAPSPITPQDLITWFALGSIGGIFFSIAAKRYAKQKHGS